MAASVFVQSVSSSNWFQIDAQSQLSYDLLIAQLERNEGATNRFQNCSVKLFNGIQEILPGSVQPWPDRDAFIKTSISLAGGKGGFGSMLRAIGAQIEKTTNREACRDLSGRRLRDINEEKRLKEWVSKQADREREKEEKKQKKLEKLRQEYQHEFHDPDYFKARSEVTDKVHEALEQGIQASTSGEPPAKKIKPANSGAGMKKSALWVGVSDDEDDSDSTSDEEDKPKASSSSSKGETESPQESTTPEESQSDQEGPKTCEPVQKPEEVEKVEPIVKSEETKTEKVETPKVEEPKKTPMEPKVYDPIDLESIESSQELESYGLEHLKNELQRRGLKCGGTLFDRATRLFSVKGLSPDEIDPSLLAKQPKKK